MSDLGRKSLDEQVEQKITTDASKSNTEKATENISGAAAIQPDSNKSTSKSLGDGACGTSDKSQTQAKSILESTKETVIKAANSAAEQIQAAASAITGAAKDSHADGKSTHANVAHPANPAHKDAKDISATHATHTTSSIGPGATPITSEHTAKHASTTSTTELAANEHNKAL